MTDSLNPITHTEPLKNVTRAILEFGAGSDIPKELENMWHVAVTGTEVQASFNGVRVIMMDEKLFDLFGVRKGIK